MTSAKIVSMTSLGLELLLEVLEDSGVPVR